MESRTLSVSVGCDPRLVYAFVSDPRNLPRWARGLLQSIRPADGGWIAETPQGPVRIRMADKNEFGVLDHYVRPADGAEVFVPVRVVPNGEGSSEVLFTLFHTAEMSDEQFADDIQLVERDLNTLKAVLESDR